MIGTFWYWWDRAQANRVWLASLLAAAAINAALFWLASLAPVGVLPGLESVKGPVAPVEIVFRPRVPPPPDLASAAPTESPPAAMPARFRLRAPVRQAWPDLRSGLATPPARLRLNLNPCDPGDPDAMRRADCAPPQDWLRADRDASELLGENAQGFTLDEVAAARGWIKSKPRTGQDAMAATTDSTLHEQIFKDAPFPPDPIERTGGW